MIINGVELNFDAFDAGQSEIAEKALEPIHNFKENDFIGMKNSEVIRIFCGKVFDFFNQVFGEGTDKKVFGNKTNMKLCIEAIIEFKEQSNKQIHTLTKKVTSKNRQQIRSAK